MKLRVEDLEGPLLDVAVAKAEGATILPGALVWPRPEAVYEFEPLRIHAFEPSTSWSDGGPIIERERIGSIFLSPANGWSAQVDGPRGDRPPAARGSTALIAAMRAYVASKLGREIEL